MAGRLECEEAQSKEEKTVLSSSTSGAGVCSVMGFEILPLEGRGQSQFLCPIVSAVCGYKWIKGG